MLRGGGIGGGNWAVLWRWCKVRVLKTRWGSGGTVHRFWFVGKRIESVRCVFMYLVARFMHLKMESFIGVDSMKYRHWTC
jgi:hypothetical protein